MRNLHSAALRAIAILAVALPIFVPRPSDADESRKYIPPVTHFTVATPGSQWLNVQRPLTTDDLRDKIVLLDFWTYCCINCIQTLPELAKLEKEFRDNLVVIGVHSGKFDQEKETDPIRQAVLRYGVEHPVVNDRDFRIWNSFNVRSWPTLILLQPGGMAVNTWVGEGHIDAVRKAIRKLIAQYPKRSKAKLPVELERDKVARGEFFYPSKLAFDDAAKILYVADSSHHQIAAFHWDPKQPAALKPAFRIGKQGDSGFKDGTFAGARFRRPQGLALAKGMLYVADTENHAIRRVDLKSKRVSTIAGNGKQGTSKVAKSLAAKTTPLASPWDVALHPDDDSLVIAMAGTHQLWSLDIPRGRISVIAGTGVESIQDGVLTENTLSQPSGLSSLLGSLYFVDAETSSLRFYFESFVRTLVGKGLFEFGMKDGERKDAKMQHPLALYADVTGIYIADTYNHAIRRYDPPKQTMETLVGDGKPGDSGENVAEDAEDSRLNEPAGITKLADGLFVIADTNNHRLVLLNRATKKIERIRIEGEKVPNLLPKSAMVDSVNSVMAEKRIAQRLPNLVVTAEKAVNRTNPEIRILLPERYKINAEGPSFLRLFEGAAPQEKLLKEWNRADLESSLVLKVEDLRSDRKYFVQGTVYYCLDAKNAVCEIASVGFPLKVDAQGQEKVEITLQKGTP